MQISAETRWFWEEHETALTATSEDWFQEPRDGVKPGGGRSRKDSYLVMPETELKELGMKRRGQQPGCEVKGLVSHLTPISTGPFVGKVELWGKWSSSSLSLNGGELVELTKERFLRKLNLDSAEIREIGLDEHEKPLDFLQPLPTIGGHVEMTRVTLANSSVWWSLGFEAFGPVNQVESALHRLVFEFQKGAPDLEKASCASYPAWLSARAAE